MDANLSVWTGHSTRNATGASARAWATAEHLRRGDECLRLASVVVAGSELDQLSQHGWFGAVGVIGSDVDSGLSWSELLKAATL